METITLPQTPLSNPAFSALKALPHEFLLSLSPEERNLVAAAYQLMDRVSQGTKIPRRAQIDFMLDMKRGRDVVIRARTGFGKTAAIVLALMACEGIGVLISPLKLLQTTQVNEFKSYGIRAVVINEDTPNDSGLWKIITTGNGVDLFIVSAEQWFEFRGHIPRFAVAMRDPNLLKQISALFVDEGHFIKTSGTSEDGRDVHRPAYARIGEIRLRLSAQVPAALLSATLPPPVLKLCTESMRMKPESTTYLLLSTNRPNLIHAIKPMAGTINNFKNLDFLVSEQSPSLTHKTLVFIESRTKCGKIQRYLNGLYPPDMRQSRPVRHIHSQMSKVHNEEAYKSFKDPEGTCRILVATSTASNGIDITDITRVVIFGVPEDLMMLEQKGGRGGRLDGIECLVLLIAEPWAYLGAGKAREIYSSNAKVQRTSKEIFVYVCLPPNNCRRKFLKGYNDDQTEEALHFSGSKCCDNDGGDFSLVDYFPVLGSCPKTPDAPSTKRKTYRRLKDRPALERLLVTWRSILHSDDPVYMHYPVEYLMTDDSISKLSQARPLDVATSEAIRSCINESDEWRYDFADEVLAVITQYDARFEIEARGANLQKAATLRAQRLKAKRMAGRPNGEDSDDYDVESEDEPEEDYYQPNQELSIHIHTEDATDSENETVNTGSENHSDSDSASQDSCPSGSSSPPLRPHSPRPNSHHSLVRPRPTEFFKENIPPPGIHATKRSRSLNSGPLANL